MKVVISFKEKTQWDIIKVMIVQEKNTMKYNEGVITLQNMYMYMKIRSQKPHSLRSWN